MEKSSQQQDIRSSTSTAGRDSQSGSGNSTRPHRRISILPDDVVARIAAGEVVQRPVSVIKELLENSLDAHATEVNVTVAGTQELTISDNGHGISPQDLPLAVLRHATSKLQSVSDLQRLDTFGFRGEALASVSTVSSKLTLCSRQKPQSSTPQTKTTVAYTLSFRDGKPIDATSTTPKPTARKIGTTVTVNDLFYNLPHRQQKSASGAGSAQDYNAIMHVIQSYAIAVAERGIGLICQKKKSNNNKSSKKSGSSIPVTTTDWNSSMGPIVKLRNALQQQNTSSTTESSRLQNLQQQATKHAIAMVYGSRIQTHLQHFSWSASRTPSSAHDNSNSNNEDTDAAPLLYQCKGYLALPSFYCDDTTDEKKKPTGTTTNKKGRKSTVVTTANASTRFVLFINQRLVDCRPLQRAAEDVYAAFSSCNKKIPFLYLHLTVPAHEVDVNVHPTKKQVTLLHLDQVCNHLSSQFQQLLEQAGQSFRQSSSTDDDDGDRNSSNNNPTSSSSINASMAPPPKSSSLSQSSLLQPNSSQQQQQQQGTKRRPPLAWGEKAKKDVDNPSDTHQKRSSKRPRRGSSNGNGENSTTSTGFDEYHDENMDDAPPSSQAAPKQQQRKKIPPSQLIRTNRASQAGALEPFLVRKSSLSMSQQSSSTITDKTPSPQQQAQHKDDCPLSKRYNKGNGGTILDMSQPGAFAILAAQCKCVNRHIVSSNNTPGSTTTPSPNAATMIRLPSQALVRPRAVVATKCEYTSIKKLRAEIQRKASPAIQAQLRSAYFVGVVSRERCLLQAGEELILLNHYQAARQLFYQLALLHFKGGARMANLGKTAKTTATAAKTVNPHATTAGSKSNPSHGGIDIVTVIADLVESEDILGRLWYEEDDNVVQKAMSTLMNTTGPLRNVSETNRTLAEQAAACLLEESELLKEYFSIRIERQAANGRIVLSGMPILLEGYTPAPHGLSLFLLRLATEVNWKDERQCFHDICSELGAFYATLPLSSSRRDVDDSHYLLPHVRHTIFPAISFLLVPPQSLQTNGHWKTVSKLSKLYKVFERC